MKPKSNYTRVMAGFYIFLCLIFFSDSPIGAQADLASAHECGLGLSCGYCLLQTDPPLYQMVEETGK